MTVHYHGTPITPRAILETLAGACFCISHAAPNDVKRCHEIGTSVMLDNGAFSVWKRGHVMDVPAFWSWALPWLDCPTTWAVIPDVIGGDWRETAKLISAAPRLPAHKISPVWHLHDPLDRLKDLCDMFPRVCFGSSEQYAEVGSDMWHQRVGEAFDALQPHHQYAQVHMLRGLQCVTGMPYPFYSVDSTDIARNHCNKRMTAADMRSRWDGMQCPIRWTPQPKEQEWIA